MELMSCAYGVDENVSKIFMKSTNHLAILSKLKLFKDLIPKRLHPVFEFIWKYVPYYTFYLDVTIVQFFTKNRMGYWFYFCTFIFLPAQPGAFSNILIIYVIGASMSLATIKSSSKIAVFFEERVGKRAINDIIKDSPVWIIINALKPLLLLCLLGMLTDCVEMHRIIHINRFLLMDYQNRWRSSEVEEIVRKVVFEIASIVTPFSGLNGGLLQLKSLLLQLPYLSFFLLSILIVIIALLWLKEKQNKRSSLKE